MKKLSTFKFISIFVVIFALIFSAGVFSVQQTACADGATYTITFKCSGNDNANAATYITKYKCFCGWGKIEEENTPGFDDHFITLSCRRCLKKYHSFIDLCGNDWMVYLKENKQ